MFGTRIACCQRSSIAGCCYCCWRKGRCIWQYSSSNSHHKPPHSSSSLDRSPARQCKSSETKRLVNWINCSDWLDWMLDSWWLQRNFTSPTSFSVTIVAVYIVVVFFFVPRPRDDDDGDAWERECRWWSVNDEELLRRLRARALAETAETIFKLFLLFSIFSVLSKWMEKMGEEGRGNFECNSWCSKNWSLGIQT